MNDVIDEIAEKLEAKRKKKPGEEKENKKKSGLVDLEQLQNVDSSDKKPEVKDVKPKKASRSKIRAEIKKIQEESTDKAKQQNLGVDDEVENYGLKNDDLKGKTVAEKPRVNIAVKKGSEVVQGSKADEESKAVQGEGSVKVGEDDESSKGVKEVEHVGKYKENEGLDESILEKDVETEATVARELFDDKKQKKKELRKGEDAMLNIIVFVVILIGFVLLAVAAFVLLGVFG